MSAASSYTIPAALRPFCREDSLAVRSPGRINLIGEHTDYNEGFVLPAAIDKAVYVTIRENKTELIRLHSVDFNEQTATALPDIRPVPGHWSTYILGVVHQFLKKGLPVKGFDIAVYGDVPLGAGLSSSAAIECAAAFAINELFGCGLGRLDLVKMAQLAEHEFAGVKCGIMDQFASMFGKKDHVIRLDCRSLDYQYFPLQLEGYRIVLLDSQVKHSLASSEYNVRRSQCEEGVALIGKKYPGIRSLRDVTIPMIEDCLRAHPLIYNRCRYVVEENLRLQEGCRDLLAGDITAFGKKMLETHHGLSELYEVSCPELDCLVEAVEGKPGVAGARMMGGGFGGCTINIVAADTVDTIIERTAEIYTKQTGLKLKAYNVEIADGTAKI